MTGVTVLGLGAVIAMPAGASGIGLVWPLLAAAGAYYAQVQ